MWKVDNNNRILAKQRLGPTRPQSLYYTNDVKSAQRQLQESCIDIYDLTF